MSVSHMTVMPVAPALKERWKWPGVLSKGRPLGYLIILGGAGTVLAKLYHEAQGNNKAERLDEKGGSRLPRCDMKHHGK